MGEGGGFLYFELVITIRNLVRIAIDNPIILDMHH